MEVWIGWVVVSNPLKQETRRVNERLAFLANGQRKRELDFLRKNGQGVQHIIHFNAGDSAHFGEIVVQRFMPIELVVVQNVSWCWKKGRNLKGERREVSTHEGFIVDD